MAIQLSEALRIIPALADGCDPNTGERFPEESPYQHPQIVRALLAAANALERQKRNEARSNNLPTRAGKPWDEEEDQLLLQRFDAKTTIPQLAQQHGRTDGAIRSRLEKLGRIQPELHRQKP
jgi:hypothetical protein